MAAQGVAVETDTRRGLAGLKGYAEAAVMPRPVRSVLAVLGCAALSSA
jgi:hypothetical protein